MSNVCHKIINYPCKRGFDFDGYVCAKNAIGHLSKVKFEISDDFELSITYAHLKYGGLSGSYFDGEWYYGQLRADFSGTFFNGEFSCYYFCGGRFLNGIWYSGIFNDGIFSGGVWKQGSFNNGVFSGGVWENGNFNGGEFSGGTWKNGYFNNGVFSGGIWEGGIFLGGVFSGGVWKGGTWRKKNFVGHGGVWEGGTWCGGYELLRDEKKVWHEAGDSPDKW